MSSTYHDSDGEIESLAERIKELEVVWAADNQQIGDLIKRIGELEAEWKIADQNSAEWSKRAFKAEAKLSEAVGLLEAQEANRDVTQSFLEKVREVMG